MTKEDYYDQGVDLFGEGKLEEAIATYQKALALDPAYSDTLHGLAQAYYAKEDFDNAIAAARRIAELDPDDILAYTSISRAYQRKGMIPEAEEAANKARVLVGRNNCKSRRPKARVPESSGVRARRPTRRRFSREQPLPAAFRGGVACG